MIAREISNRIRRQITDEQEHRKSREDAQQSSVMQELHRCEEVN